jgi:spermidine synthase
MEGSVTHPRPEQHGGDRHSAPFRSVLYAGSFVTGAIVMSFEMLGSRYLNPYFGGGIYTWAALISTVLAALTVGYFLGGVVADRRPSAAVLGTAVAIGSAFILALPNFATTILEGVLDRIDDIKTGSLVSAFAIMFFPVAFYGAYSPFAIRLLLRTTRSSGGVSGAVYAISTAGSIFGTLGTTFFLIPAIGTRSITYTLGAAGMVTALLLIACGRRAATLTTQVLAVAIAVAMLAVAAPCARAAVFDRATLLGRDDGQLAHIEGQYNDIFVTKRGNELLLSSRLKGWNYTESRIDLTDPEIIPSIYLRRMTTVLAYAPRADSILLVGLGGGVLTNYVGHYLPQAELDTVEIDPGMIDAAKSYFEVAPSERMRLTENDGRVFLNRSRKLYDVAFIDAYIGVSVPFHLMTREFYTLLKRHLAPGGAAVFNIHEVNRLFAISLRTLRAEFANVELYRSGLGEVAVVASDTPRSAEALQRRAEELQNRYGFRYPLPDLLTHRAELDPGAGEILTDDFAPVDVYVADGPQWRGGAGDR